MATNRFYGAIGFAVPTEISNGKWDDVITVRSYYGDVTRNARRLETGEKVNSDLAVENTISIVADPYASEHIFAMRYVSWLGALWIVSTVEVQSPRLLLRLGGVYNGPTPAPSGP
jgi:hypothetical protein